MKTLNKIILFTILNNFFAANFVFAEDKKTCNPALAKELEEISKKQKILLDSKSGENLEEIEKSIRSDEAQKIALLTLTNLQKEFNASIDEIKKMENQVYLSEDAANLIADLDKHVNNVAAHQSLRKTLDLITSPDGKGVLMDFINEKKLNGKTDINVWYEKNFYNYMKGCDPENKPHCKNFLDNLSVYRSANQEGTKYESKFTIIDEDKIKNIIDNYGALLFYITEEGGDSSPKFKEALAKHKAILNDDKLVTNQVSLFSSDTDKEVVQTLINLYREVSKHEVHNSISPKLIVGNNFLDEGQIDILRRAKLKIDRECNKSNKSCAEVLENDTELKKFPEILKELASAISIKTGKEYNLDNIYSKNSEDFKEKTYKKIEEILRNNKVPDSIAISKDFKDNCAPIQEVLGAQKNASLQDMLDEGMTSEKYEECIKILEKPMDSLNKDIAAIDARLMKKEKQLKDLIAGPEFKELEILKAALFNQYYSQCIKSKDDSDDNASKCGLTLFDHTKTVDHLTLLAEDINGTVEIRNYLKYLGFSDNKDKFSEPGYWASILRNQCKNYSSSASQDADEDQEDNMSKCGFSSCNACATIANLGKNAVVRQESARFVDLPMHQYREYDKKTGRMLIKRHPISSIVANTLKYASSNQVLGSVAGSLIGTQKLRGNLWSMQQNALYTKQSIHWNKQYQTQMYNQLDLRNPNLFGNYFGSTSTMGFPVN